MDTAAAEGRLGHDVGWEFMVAEKKGLVWCHVFKSASSRSVTVTIAGGISQYLGPYNSSIQLLNRTEGQTQSEEKRRLLRF